MHFRRFASFLLGLWLAGCVLMDVVAIQNFRSVDRLLAAPGIGAAAEVRSLGHENARTFLRHHVAEQNRWYFEQWERVQFGVGLILFLVLLFGAPPNKYSLLLCLGMIAIVAVERFLLTPEIARLGRALDFIPAGIQSPDRDNFWSLHGIYSGVELGKSGLGLVIAGLLLIRWRKDRGHFARQANPDRKLERQYKPDPNLVTPPITRSGAREG